MATKPEVRRRPPKSQKPQAEDRKEQREEEAHQLNLDNHELEKTKVIVDVLKHIATVITALLFILSYFGDQVIPRMRDVLIFGQSSWDLVVFGIYSSLAWSLVLLIFMARNPIWPDGRRIIRATLALILTSLAVAMLFILVSLTKLP